MPRAATAILVCAIGLSALAGLPVAGASIDSFAQAAGVRDAGAVSRTAPDPGQMLSPEMKLASHASKTDEAAPTPAAPVSKKAPEVRPGSPTRKPPRPVVTRGKTKAARTRKSRSPLTGREKKLCRALQKCRNKFIWCKGKIKHPDQSQAWAIAKEVCGAHYKTCVETDFQSGEWFFTRWFYFQELDCK